MINSHAEVISEIKLFCDKMELINTFKYIKDVETLPQEVDKSQPRMLLVGLEGLSLDDENYNMVLSYKFIIADETIYDDASVVNSETENMFCLSALSDYFKHINDTPIEFNSISTTTESTSEKTFTTISGSFEFIVKRSPSYWKKMEAYNG